MAEETEQARRPAGLVEGPDGCWVSKSQWAVFLLADRNGDGDESFRESAPGEVCGRNYCLR